MFWDVWNEETVALGGYMSAAHESRAYGHLTFPSQITWMIYRHFTPTVVKIVPPTLLSSHAPFSGIPHVKGKQQNPTSSYTPVAHHVPTILRGSSPRWHHEPSAEEEMWVPGVRSQRMEFPRNTKDNKMPRKMKPVCNWATGLMKAYSGQ